MFDQHRVCNPMNASLSVWGIRRLPRATGSLWTHDPTSLTTATVTTYANYSAGTLNEVEDCPDGPSHGEETLR